MSQDNKKSFVMYQGDGSNNVFSVPMTKGKYGTISVAFVRRGLDQYEYNPDTWGLNGGLFAWDLSGTKVYTDTATPAIGATVYDQYGVGTGDTVTAVGGATITVNTNVYTRDTLHDVDENTVLTWTGDTLQIGDYIVIERTTTRTQPFEFQNNQKHIEKSDDNLERQIQEVADKVDNALLVDPTHTIDSNKMNPVEWMKTILRSVDKSVRGFRYLNGWLDYSLDDPNIADAYKTWTHLLNTYNIKAVRERSRIENGKTVYWTEYLAQDGSWKILSRGDFAKLSDLADVDFTNLSAGNFIMFDGLKWKNVYSSATAGWGTLIGDINDQTDLFDTFVKKTGDTLTGMYKHNYGSRVRFMANNSTVNYTDLFMNGPEFEILFHTNNNTYDGLYGRATNGYVALYPGTDNQAWLGLGGRRWKKVWATELCPDTTNILTIPNKTGILATKGDVDLAANSGDQLTEKGVWYAKMYSATVAPSAEDGTNYADFSQTDGQGNPIIVIYKRQNGAWVQDQTITPPAEYNGYVPVTSKIWDIVEQAGQQGGKVLWSHNQKTFTPSPLIILFEDIEVTGDSTVIMPANPTDNSIPSKKYIDDLIANLDVPELFDWKWKDCTTSRTTWALSDGNWVTDKSDAYQHLVDDYNGISTVSLCYVLFSSIRYYRDATADVPGADYQYAYTSIFGSVCSTIYSTSNSGSITANYYDGSSSGANNLGMPGYGSTKSIPSYSSESIGGTRIYYFTASDGHKMVIPNQESNVAAIYTATGVAWYYVLDTTNQRFKLPRSKHNKYAASLGVFGNGITLGLTDGTDNFGLNNVTGYALGIARDRYGTNVGTASSGAAGVAKTIGITTDSTKSGIIAQQTQDTDQYKYLYFYVGN